ncbi:uncharacterized protein AAES06_002595 [Glossophaga mutica]
MAVRAPPEEDARCFSSPSPASCGSVLRLQSQRGQGNPRHVFLNSWDEDQLQRRRSNLTFPSDQGVLFCLDDNVLLLSSGTNLQFSLPPVAGMLRAIKGIHPKAKNASIDTEQLLPAPGDRGATRRQGDPAE